MLLDLTLLFTSFALLYFGAEFVLSSAEKIGRYFKLSPLVIGLLLVGFGTSLPEFFVSQLASYRGAVGISLGNIVGSNISNLFLILGVSGLLVPLHLNRKDIYEQSLFHIVITLLLIGVLSFSVFNLFSSLFLVAFFVIYLYSTFKRMEKEANNDDEEDDIRWYHFILLLIGFGLLYGGGELLVKSGLSFGRKVGISEYVLSSIFVAFGTSFPELMTALLACFKKKDVDLITGNIIGSNIFNVAFVLGSLGIYDFKIEQKFYIEFGVLLFAALFLFLLAQFKKNFHRLAGVVFLIIYGGIITYWINQ